MPAGRCARGVPQGEFGPWAPSTDRGSLRPAAQAQELLEALADEKKPVIVVGDLNTPAPNGETYEEFVSEAEGFVDVWTHNLKKGEGEGFTFQHDLNHQE